MILYNSFCTFKDKLGYVYSCDMVRLQCQLSAEVDAVEHFENYFKSVNNFRVFGEHFSSALGKYSKMWQIQGKYTTITVMYGFNGYTNNVDDRHKVILEFNPNKLDYDDFREIQKILNDMWEVELVRWDLAIDIPIKREYLHLIKDQRSYEFHDHNKNGITEYLGARNTTNRVKLYDKQLESDLDVPMTRLEMTCSGNYTEYLHRFPKVIVQHENYALEMILNSGLNKSDLSTLELFKSIDDFNTRLKILDGFSRIKREKISPYVLADTYELQVDNECVKSVFNYVFGIAKYKRFDYGCQE